MAGGPWSAATIGQGRPGLFINFVPAALAAIAPGVRGVVASIVKAPWGPDKKVQVIYNESDLLNYYTANDTSPNNAYYEAHHAFLGGALGVVMYRVEGSGAAKATHTFVDTTGGTPVDAIRIDGKYNGVLGSGFSVAIVQDPVITTATDVLIYQGSKLLATYVTSVVARGTSGHMAEIVSLINADPNNFWVTATLLAEGNSTPASAAAPGTSLSGGSDGAGPTMGDYTAAMTALETQAFNVYHSDVVDADVNGIIAATKAWIDGMRNYGKYVMWVAGSAAAESLATAMGIAAGLNDPAISYVYPGAYEMSLEGVRTLYRGAAYAAMDAGMLASMVPGQDMTYDVLPNLVDLEARLNNGQIKQGLASGLLLHTFDGIQFKIEEAINTLVTLGANQGDSWKLLQAINTMDAISTGITVSGNANYVGKVPNDSVGRSALVGAVRDFLRSMANSRAIETDYKVGLDPARPSSGSQVFLAITLRPVQSMKFIYFTVTVG